MITLSTWAEPLRKKNGAHVVKRGIRIMLLLLGIPPTLIFRIFRYLVLNFWIEFWFLKNVPTWLFGYFEIFFDIYFSSTAKLAMGSLAQNSSGVIRCSCNTRFRRRFRTVPDPSGADGWWGSGGFRRRWLMRLWRVQIADKVLEGSGPGAESWWASRGFRCRWLMRVLEGSGADSQKLSQVFQAVGDNVWYFSICFLVFNIWKYFKIFSNILE